MLYLIATPVGNLKDITFRAVEVLKEVDIIACEDTRSARKLLNNYDIKKKLVSFHEYNEEKSGSKIIAFINQGLSVALISDRGTPGISDPGYTIVRKAIEEDIDFTMIPGPSAVLMALVLSGLPVHSFLFRGFPPHKKGRQKFLKSDANIPYSLVYYESPYRLIKFIKEAIEILGDRKAAIANDLTKKFEKVVRGNLTEILEVIQEKEIRGEYTIVIEGFKDNG